MERLFAIVGSLSALTAVAAGAFGAHALRARLAPDLLAVFETAARYQMYHALGLFAVAWIGDAAAVLLIAIRTYRLIFHPEDMHDPKLKATE